MTVLDDPVTSDADTPHTAKDATRSRSRDFATQERAAFLRESSIDTT
jgi:hypothetical protein